MIGVPVGVSPAELVRIACADVGADDRGVYDDPTDLQPHRTKCRGGRS